MVNRDKVAIVPKPLGVAFGFRLKVDTAEYDHPVLSDNQNFDLFDHFYGNIRHFAILCVYAAYKEQAMTPGSNKMSTAGGNDKVRVYAN